LCHHEPHYARVLGMLRRVAEYRACQGQESGHHLTKAVVIEAMSTSLVLRAVMALPPALSLYNGEGGTYLPGLMENLAGSRRHMSGGWRMSMLVLAA
jgi:hypothetical protein